MTVLVLRDERGEPLCQRLADRGVAAERVSPVRFEPLSHEVPDAVDWLVVTSAVTVGMVGRWPRARRVAAVGGATARTLETTGLRVDFTPRVASGAGLGAELPGRRGESVWLPRSALATEELPKLLADKGFRVATAAVYQTIIVPVAVAGRHRLIAAFSPSGVAALPERCDVPVVAIGEPTARAVRQRGFVLAGEASAPTDEKMSELICRLVGMEET